MGIHRWRMESPHRCLWYLWFLRAIFDVEFFQGYMGSLISQGYGISWGSKLYGICDFQGNMDSLISRGYMDSLIYQLHVIWKLISYFYRSYRIWFIRVNLTLKFYWISDSSMLYWIYDFCWFFIDRLHQSITDGPLIHDRNTYVTNGSI